MEETTLLFRHLPAELSTDERKDFLYHFGATRCRVFGESARMANTAFATFPSKEHASKVLHQLHQAELLGSTLKVEFARDNSQTPSVVDDEGKQAKTQKSESKEDKDKEGVNVKPQEIKFDTTFNIWGITHPRPPQLKYRYPPPTAVVLTNIMNALASVPKFYVQVLHLMNKMDLPCPFGPLTAAPPLHKDVNGLTEMDDIDQREMEISSETESELETDNEEGLARPKQERPVKRLLQKSARKPRLKKRRLADLQEDAFEPLPPSHPTLPVAEVFDQISDASSQAARKIELKIPITVAPASHASYRERSANDDRTNVGRETSQEFGPPLPPLLAESFSPQIKSQIQNTSFHARAPHEPLPTSLPVPPGSLASSVPLPPLPPPPVLPPAGDRQGQGHSILESEGDTQTWEEAHPGTAANALEPPEEPSLSSTGGFGIIKPLPKDSGKQEEVEESDQRQWSKMKFITSSELRKGRLSEAEMRDLSVYKRYEPGEASCRLYIKNVAKQANEKDLHWLYGRYVDWDSESEQNIFDICLMKTGRMKGQAFVTLPSEEVATDALRDTNGYLLKDKPLVVQFARSAKAQEEGSSGASKSR